MAMTLQIRKRGALILPISLRRKYRLEDGDPITLIDVGDGIFLSPRPALLPKLAGEIESLRAKYHLSLEDLIKGVAEEREKYGGYGER
jgi:bifunctional DNA-binding transcriptional regulator/antitoxin component of YhaV-PrlF toxin-antitoxin module